MAHGTVVCPDCGTKLKVNDPSSGKRIECPRCGTRFAVAAKKQEQPLRAIEVEDDEAEEVRRVRPRRRQQQAGGQGLVIGLALGGVLLLVAIAVGVWFFVLSPGQKNPPTQAGFQAQLPAPRPSPPPDDSLPTTRREEPLPGRGTRPPAESAAAPTIASAPVAPAPRKPMRGRLLASLNLSDVSVGDLKARSAQELEGLRYLPADVSAVVGLDLSHLTGDLVIEWFLGKVAMLGDENPLDRVSQLTGLAIRDLDHVVVGGSLEFGPDFRDEKQGLPFVASTYVIKTKAILNRATLLQVAKAGPGRTIQGKELYPVPSGNPNTRGLLYMPAERILIFTTLPDAQLSSLLGAGGQQPSLAAPMLSALGGIGPAQVWLSLTGNHAREKLAGEAAPFAPSVGNSLGPVGAVGLGASAKGNLLHLSLCLTCNMASQAEQLMTSFKEQMARSAVDPAGNPAASALHELSQSTKWTVQGANVQAAGQIGFKSLDALLKLADPLEATQVK